MYIHIDERRNWSLSYRAALLRIWIKRNKQEISLSFCYGLLPIFTHRVFSSQSSPHYNSMWEQSTTLNLVSRNDGIIFHQTFFFFFAFASLPHTLCTLVSSSIFFSCRLICSTRQRNLHSLSFLQIFFSLLPKNLHTGSQDRLQRAHARATRWKLMNTFPDHTQKN